MQNFESFNMQVTLSPAGEMAMATVSTARNLRELVNALKDEKEKSFRDLEVDTGVSATLLRRMANEDYVPTEIDVFQRLAIKTGLSLQRIFELAGFVPPNSPYSPVAREIAGLVDRLPDDKKADAVAILRALWERHEQSHKT